MAGMGDRAGPVFRLLGNRATDVPWSCTGDAERLFVRRRDERAADAR
ncbi:hypothetical protein J3A78_001198 [Streptomyces sp. PvR006]|nr:hypothetical protein [Streptomyces sp. PvR006]MBP2580720.1 hypothetical protein [Streptomyces sp. PvR006]